MKYKAKFSADQKHFHTSYTMRIDEGQVLTDVEGLTPGVLVFIPFTDQRFFEPVKTRKFQVEMNEDDFKFFDHFIANDDRWTVTEITEPSWVDQYYKSGAPNAFVFSTDELYTIDVKEFKDEYQYGNKLGGVKWIKDRFGKGLRESKDLADFIFTLSI